MTTAAEFQTMTTDQILKDATTAILECRQFEGVAEVVRRIIGGRMTENQFLAAQRVGFEQIYPEMIEAFKAGYLFGCQGLDFLSCMMLTQHDVEKDRQRWEQMRGAAEVLGRDKDEAFKEFKDFADSRIMPSYSTRQQFIGPGWKLKKADELTKAQRETFRQLRENFLTASMRWSFLQNAQGEAIGKSDDIEAIPS